MTERTVTQQTLFAVSLAAGLIAFVLVIGQFKPVIQLAAILLALAMTVIAVTHRARTAVMVLAGMLIYASSWPTSNLFGITIGSAFCLIGFLLWFGACAKAIVEIANGKLLPG